MSSSRTTLAIELQVPYASDERDFLRLAVETAARKHRELQRSHQEENIRRHEKVDVGLS